MTSVPKPLKFLRPHYGTLKAYYETMADSDLKVVYSQYCNPLSIWFFYKKNVTLLASLLQKYMADILSVLALTMSAEGERVCLLSLILIAMCSFCFFVLISCAWSIFSVFDVSVSYSLVLMPYSSSITWAYAVTLKYK